MDLPTTSLTERSRRNASLLIRAGKPPASIRGCSVFTNPTISKQADQYRSMCAQLITLLLRLVTSVDCICFNRGKSYQIRNNLRHNISSQVHTNTLEAIIIMNENI